MAIHIRGFDKSKSKKKIKIKDETIDFRYEAFVSDYQLFANKTTCKKASLVVLKDEKLVESIRITKGLIWYKDNRLLVVSASEFKALPILSAFFDTMKKKISYLQFDKAELDILDVDAFLKKELDRYIKKLIRAKKRRI